MYTYLPILRQSSKEITEQCLLCKLILDWINVGEFCNQTLIKLFRSDLKESAGFVEGWVNVYVDVMRQSQFGQIGSSKKMATQENRKTKTGEKTQTHNRTNAALLFNQSI